MEKFSKKRLMLVAGVVLGFVGIIIIISVVLMILNQKKYRVIIDNVEECSIGISSFSKDVLFNDAYNLVKSQNDVEKRQSSEMYHAVLRDGTCKTKSYNEVDGITSYSTEAILDVEEANYSFRVNYYWVVSDREIDLGTIEMTCLEPDELLYGEFNCKDNPMALTKLELDPILKVLPYFGDDFILKPKLETNENGEQYYVVVIEYDPPESVYMGDNFSEYISGKKQEAVEYLESQGINVEDYKLEETYYVVH